MFRNFSIFLFIAINVLLPFNKSQLRADDLNKLLKEGREKLIEKDYDQALKKFDKLIKKNPNSWQGYHNRGISKFNLNDFNGAKTDLNKSINLNQNPWSESFYLRGLINQQLERIDDAIIDFTEALEIASDNNTKELAFYNRAFNKFNLKDYDGAIKDYSKVIELNSKNYNAFNNRGLANEILGKLDNAKSDYKNALDLNPEFKETQENLKELDRLNKIDIILEIYKNIDVEEINKDYKKIINLNFKIIEILEEMNEKRTSPYHQIAINYYRLRNYEKAKFYQRKAIEIEESISGINSLIKAELLDGLALYFNNGQISLNKKYFKEVETILKDSLKIRISLFGEDNINSASGYNKLSNLYADFGYYEKSISLGKKSIEIVNKLDENIQWYKPLPLYKSYLYKNIANSFQKIGDLNSAKNYIEKSIKILKSFPIKDQRSLAENYSALSLIFLSLGDNEGSKNMSQKSLSIYKKDSFKNTKKIKETKKILEIKNFLSKSPQDRLIKDSKIKFLYDNDISDKDSEAIHKLRVNASTLITNGSFGESISLNERARYLINKSSGNNNFGMFLVLKDLGTGYLYSDDLINAEKNLNEAYILYKKLFSDSNISQHIIHLYDELALLYLLKGSFQDSQKFYSKSIESKILYVREQSQFFEEKQRINLSKLFLENINDIYSLIDILPQGEILAFKARLNRQGILEDIEKYQSKISKLDISNKTLFEKLRILDNQISNFNIIGKEREKINNQKINLEKILYSKIPTLKPNIIEPNQIKEVLPSNSVLIEFQKYYLTNPENIFVKEFRYGAFIFNSNGDISFIDIGSAKNIESQINKALYSTKNYLDDAPDLWQNLGKKLFNPLLSKINSADILFITPDSELNRIPFSALGVGNNKKYLSDIYKLRLLTTGRDLLDLRNMKKSNLNQSIVLANPFFDLNKSTKIYNSKNKQIRSRDFKSKKWDRLPGTKREGETISNLIDAQLIEGEYATASFLQNIQSPKIIHIASHAEFLSDEKDKYNPLLRGMVILAGANNLKSNLLDDGILTGLEVTRLNWKDTDLVVISACDSGVGDIKSGEGIYGLKRAIAIAGAKSSLLSLWKVNDDATAVFMESYYKKLKKGQGKADALLNTQKEFRNSNNYKYTHPNIWAAFQLSGDWRPIDF